MQQLFANPFAAYAETQDRIATNRMNEQRNALEMDRFKMQQAELQAQAEARRRVQEAEARRRAGQAAAYGQAYGRQPAPQAQAPQPMGQPASAQLMPQAPQMTADGREIDRVTVSGQMNRQPSQLDLLKLERQFYIDNKDYDSLAATEEDYRAAVDAERKAATAEEQQGYDLNSKTYEGIAQWAVLAMPQIAQISNAPGWDRQVMSMVQDAAQRLNRMGLDGNLLLQEAQIQPGDTPQSIAAELDQLISQMGGSDAIKSRFNTRTVDAGNRQLTVTNSGSLVRNDAMGVDPNTALQSQTQIRTAGIGANSRIRAADLNRQGAAAMAAAGGKIELVPADDLPDGE